MTIISSGMNISWLSPSSPLCGAKIPSLKYASLDKQCFHFRHADLIVILRKTPLMIPILLVFMGKMVVGFPCSKSRRLEYILIVKAIIV